MIGMFKKPSRSFLIGLTDEDMEHLQKGGKVTVNPKDVGWEDIEVVIFYGQNHEKMIAELPQHDGEIIASKIVKSHGDGIN
jgi:hypothetical protein